MSALQEPDITSCATCGSPIHWRRTTEQRWMPIDAWTTRPHWETCPTAEIHRRDKPKPPQPPLTGFFS